MNVLPLEVRPVSGVGEHHFAAVANTITPEDERIRPKHVELYYTCNKAIHWLHQVGYSFTLCADC
jgi:hypothetical protein